MPRSQGGWDFFRDGWERRSAPPKTWCTRTGHEWVARMYESPTPWSLEGAPRLASQGEHRCAPAQLGARAHRRALSPIPMALRIRRRMANLKKSRNRGKQRWDSRVFNPAGPCGSASPLRRPRIPSSRILIERLGFCMPNERRGIESRERGDIECDRYAADATPRSRLRVWDAIAAAAGSPFAGEASAGSRHLSGPTPSRTIARRARRTHAESRRRYPKTRDADFVAAGAQTASRSAQRNPNCMPQTRRPSPANP